MLRKLPGVDHVLERAAMRSFFENIPKTIMVNSIRNTLENLRDNILKNNLNIREECLSEDRIIKLVEVAVKETMAFNLKHLINATGVVVHTNLGRSLLAPEVIENLVTIGGRYSNLEYDLHFHICITNIQ